MRILFLMWVEEMAKRLFLSGSLCNQLSYLPFVIGGGPQKLDKVLSYMSDS